MIDIFAPAIRLANKLRYPQKLILLGGMIFIAFLFLLFILFQQLSQTVESSKAQLEGVEHIVELNSIIKLVQQYRGLSLHGKDASIKISTLQKKRQQEIDEKLNQFLSVLDPKMSLIIRSGNPFNFENETDLSRIIEFWGRIKDQDQKVSSQAEFKEITELVKQLHLLMKLISGHYQLLSDTDISAYYMTDILLHSGTDITETMGNLRAIMFASLVDKPAVKAEDTVVSEIKFSLDSNIEDFTYKLSKIVHFTPELREKMTFVHSQLLVQRDNILKQFNQYILNEEAKISPEELWNTATLNIDQIFKLLDEHIAPSLKKHIQSKINRAYFIIELSIFATLVVMLLMIYFSIAWYKSMINSIDHIRTRVSKFSDNDFSSEIQLNTSDELKDISVSINDMVSKINRSRDRLMFQQEAINRHAIISITDVKGNITYVNSKFEQISQYSKDELIGQNHRMIRSDHHSLEFFRDMWQTISRGNVWHGEIKNRAKDGSFYWIEATIVPRLNNKGKPIQYIAIRTDITNIKVMEMELMKTNKALLSEQLTTKEEAKRLDNIIDIAMDASIQIDVQGIIVGWNRRAEIIFGWSKAEAIGSVLHTLVIPEKYRKSHIEGFGRCLKRGISDFFNSPLEITGLNSQGKEFPIEISVSQVEYKGSYQFSAFIRDLSQQKNYEASILQAKESATKANRVKSDFLSSMSHELRTPLNAILGFAELIEMGSGTPLSDKQRKSMKQIIGSGEHLLNLVNDVLELSEIESGNIKLSIEPLEIKNEIKGALSLMTAVAENSDIEIKTPSELPFKLLADKTKLKQILINLITNAIKYNRKGGSVTLNWQKTRSNRLRISVIDTGIGISDENKAKLFVAFDRLGQEKSKIEGTGIGLVVTKQLVESMDGIIGVDSIENQGSNFWFELPLAES